LSAWVNRGYAVEVAVALAVVVALARVAPLADAVQRLGLARRAVRAVLQARGRAGAAARVLLGLDLLLFLDLFADVELLHAFVREQVRLGLLVGGRQRDVFGDAVGVRRYISLGEQAVELDHEGDELLEVAVLDARELFGLEGQVLLAHELAEQEPVVAGLDRVAAVVEGVHGQLARVVAREDLCDDEAVVQVAAGVFEGVGQVQALDPLDDFARQRLAHGDNCPLAFN
jgi:hypothetical protein